MKKKFKRLAICLAVVAISAVGYNVASALPPYNIEDLLTPQSREGGGGGKTCNGATNCSIGRSAKRDGGEITMCCGADTPDETGHYHS